MANNLYEYYQSKGEALPTVAQRQGVATQAGITGYTGTKDQNISLLGFLQGTPSSNNVITPDSLNPVNPIKLKDPVQDNSSVGMNASIGNLLKTVTDQQTKDQTEYDKQQAEVLKSIQATGDTGAKTEQIIKDNSVDTLKKTSNDLSSQIEAEQKSTADKIKAILGNGGITKEQAQPQIDQIQRTSASKIAELGIGLSAINRQYETASNIANRQITANSDMLKTDLEAKKFVLDQLGTKLATEKSNAFTLQIKQIDNETKLMQDAIKTATDGMSGGSVSGDVGGKALQDFVSGKISLSDFYKQINADPTTTTTGSNIAGYDITSYATDPKHEQKVISIYSTIPFVSDAKTAQESIKKLSPNSPITGEMVMASAKKYGVDPSLMIAIMQQDSSLGTAGLGVKTKNAGNVGNDDAGNTKTFSSWADGVDAVGNWLSKHPATNSATDYIYGDFTKTISPQGASVFNKLPSNDKTTVMQLVSGDALIADLIRSRGASGTKEIERITNLAKQVDPTFSINNNKIKYQAKQQWNNPNAKAFLTRSAMNTAMSHMATTYESAKLLGNTEIPKYNDLQNWFSKNTGNPELTSFVYDLTALAGEVASAYKNGTAPSELDTQRFFDAMSGSMSPEQLKGVFTQSSELMGGKLRSLAQEYKQSVGSYPADPIIQPSVLQDLKDSGVDTSSIDKLLQEQGYQNNSVNYDTGMATQLAQLQITDGGNNTLLIPRTQWSKLTSTHDETSGLSRADALMQTLKDNGYTLLVK